MSGSRLLAVQPNVLMIVMDAARRDALEPYGAPAGQTPVLAQLARRGHVVDGVYATSSWTVPSHSSLFSGLMPRAAGLSQVPSPAIAKAATERLQQRLLASVLHRAGYATGALSSNVWVSPATGFDLGFSDFVVADSGRNARIRDHSFREQFRWVLETVRARVDDGAAVAERTLANWAGDASRRPFFWFVNLLECHSPYLPPRPFGGTSPVRRLRASRDARRHYTLESIWRTCSGVEQVPPPTLRRLREMYNASVTYMDRWLGRVLEHLDRGGVLDETLVIVLSDHGESFGESGLIAHGLSLGDHLVRVPFVCAGPRADSLKPRSLAALPRLLVELADIGDHPYTDGPPDGFGVAQFDPIVDADDEDGRRALAAMGIVGAAHERFTTPLTAVIGDQLKLLVSGEREVVYDLAADPGEFRPLEEAGLRERKAQIDALRKVLSHPSMKAETEPGEPLEPAPISDRERRELEERMRLLGYL